MVAYDSLFHGLKTRRRHQVHGVDRWAIAPAGLAELRSVLDESLTACAFPEAR